MRFFIKIGGGSELSRRTQKENRPCASFFPLRLDFFEIARLPVLFRPAAVFFYKTPASPAGMAAFLGMALFPTAPSRMDGPQFAQTAFGQYPKAVCCVAKAGITENPGPKQAAKRRQKILPAFLYGYTARQKVRLKYNYGQR